MSSVRPLLYLNKKRWNIGLLVCPERPEVHVPILGSVSQSEHTKVAKNCFNFCQNRGGVYASFQERTADWRKSTFTGVSRPLGSFVASDNRIWQWPLEGSVLLGLPPIFYGKHHFTDTAYQNMTMIDSRALLVDQLI